MRWILFFQCFMMAWVPAVAQVAANVVREMDPGDITLGTVGMVLFFCLWGWAVSRLDMIADFVKGDLKVRAEIVRQILASITAGVLGFIAAKVGGQSTLLAMIATFSAAFMGDVFLSRYIYGRDRAP